MITDDPSVYKMHNPNLIVGIFMENSIGPKRVINFFSVYFQMCLKVLVL